MVILKMVSPSSILGSKPSHTKPIFAPGDDNTLSPLRCAAVAAEKSGPVEVDAGTSGSEDAWPVEVAKVAC